MNYLPFLNDFESVDLNSLNSVQMFNRKDTKYVFNINQLSSVLENLISSYKILKIDDNLIFNYNNQYYDTKDFLFYNQHHNENRNRFKVRYRNYSSTNSTYFEIKTKNNKDRTIKKRIESRNLKNKFNEVEKNLVHSIIGLNSENLTDSININFSRISFVDKKFTERLTLDTNLMVKNGVDHKIFSNLIIAEIKQSKYNPKSPFITLLREMKIPEMKFSKYCMGLIHLHPELKKNRFKPKLNSINKILNQKN